MSLKLGIYIKIAVILVILVGCAPVDSASLAAPALQKESPSLSSISQAEVNDFHLLTPDKGWLLLADSLYWTADGGKSWQDITPPRPAGASIQAITFLDEQIGFAVITGQDDTGFPTYSLARTSDGGVNWQVSQLPLFESGDPGALPASVYMDFLDPLTGWITVKTATSAVFSLGELFGTVDGGKTWTRLDIPFGGPVYFVTPLTGWIAGGPTGDQLYLTQDGGQSWVSQALPAPVDTVFLYQLPSFTDEQHGSLPVGVNDPSGSRVDFYITADGGQTWQVSSSAVLSQAVSSEALPPLSIQANGDWILVDLQAPAILTSQNGVQSSTPIPSGSLAEGITALDMVGSSYGWARYDKGNCQPAPDDALTCQSEAGLLATSDGGSTWSFLALPGAQSKGLLSNNTMTVTGHGFNSCTAPTLSQMQAWIDHSPYRYWNLYIGGSSLYSGCGSLSASYISMLNSQGWKFIVTWAGVQAACFKGTHLMSFDPAVAYNQGVSEADQAIERAANLQLTLVDKTGAVIYYDLEAYDTTNAACQAAAESFVSGWSARLKSRGIQAGVYSTRYALNHFATIATVPDVVWIASYSYSTFTSSASVWDIPGLSNDYWVDHQRLRQYAGGHNETWGNVTININSDVADGVVLNMGGPPVAQLSAPTDNTWIGPGQTISATVKQLDPSFAITKVEFQWHDANWLTSSWQPLGTDTNGSDGWSVPFTASASMCNQQGLAIYATVYNSANAHSSVGVWNLGVDCRPPIASVLTSPAYVSGSPFRDFLVKWSGTDAETGLASYDVQYKDGSGGVWTDLLTSTTTTSFDFPGSWTHTYYFRIRARDIFGNLGAWTTNDIHYTVPPANCTLPPDSYEADNSAAAAKAVTVDGPAYAHNFDQEGDADWIKFSVPGMTAVSITTTNTGGLGDTVLYLYAKDGKTLLASNDDYPSQGLGSRIARGFATSGTYYAKVVHYDRYASGCKTQYSLQIVTIPSYWVILPLIQR